MTGRRVAVVLTALLLLGAAFGAGWYFGGRAGRMDGFNAGIRYGEVQASKKAPVPVRNRNHPTSELLATEAFAGLPLQGDEGDALAALVNRSISPCPKEGQRGVSLATSLLDDACPAVTSQVRLALAVLRTYGGGDGASPEARAEAIEEGVAVLRVERRLPVPPDAPRPPRGNPDAAVTLTVFSDFQCPYCFRGEKVVEELLKEHGDRVRVVARHLPLTRIHPAAWPAAVAADAAGEQGKYWEMHEALFAVGTRKLGDGIDTDDPFPAEGAVAFEDLAATIGLDVERFRADARSVELQKRVQDDMDLARSLGVGGTPAFFFDGREVTERRSPELFAMLLDKAEAEADWRFSWGLEPPPPGATAPNGVGEPGAEGADEAADPDAAPTDTE